MRSTTILIVLVTCATAAFAQGTRSELEQAAKGTAGRFVKAVRAGNADDIRATLLPAVDSMKADQDRWIQSLVQIGPRLGAEQLKEIGAVRLEAEFAIVQGGLTNRTCMRLIRKGPEWRILGEGDPVKLHALSKMQMLTLTSLEDWAERQWPFSLASTPASKPTTRPAPAKALIESKTPLGPAISEILPYLVDYMPKVKSSDAPSHMHEDAVELLLIARDYESARQLLEVSPQTSDMMQYVGELGIRLPGGMDGPEGAAMQKRRRASSDQWGPMSGMAVGRARAGETTLAIAQLKEFGWREPLLRAKMLEIAPTKDLLASLQELGIAKYPSEHVYAPIVRAKFILDDEAGAEETIAEYRRLDRSSKSSDPWIEDDRLRRAKEFGLIWRGELDRVRKAADERYATDMNDVRQAIDKPMAELGTKRRRTNSYRLVMAGEAIRGNASKIQADLEKIGVKDGMALEKLFIAYALARNGDLRAAEKIVDEVPMAGSERLTAIGFGLLASARHSAGDSEQTIEYIRRGIAYAENGKKDLNKAIRVQRVLSGLIRGPEALLYEDDRLNSYPLR